MPNTAGTKKFIVGVDGSEASVEALRQARDLAVGDTQIEAIACWEYPQMYDGYVMMGIEGFEESAAKVMAEAVTRAFGAETPRNLRTRLLQGDPKALLMDESKSADMLILGRRGHGRFTGMLLGSVSSSSVARAKCPVLVVHAPEK